MLKCNWPKWIFPWGILPLGLGAAALLFNTDSLESKLQAAATDQLKAGEAGWASVTMDGRDASLSGEAPDRAELEKAAKLVTGTYGVRRVETATASVAPPVVLGKPTVNPFRDEAKNLEISGTWPEGKAKTLSVSVAGKTYELGQSSELTSDGNGNWKLVPEQAPAVGKYPVDVRVTDGKNAESTISVADALEVEEPKAPLAPTMAAVSGFGNLPGLSGKWPEEAGSSLAVGIAGKDYVLGTDKQLTSDGAGNWAFTPPSTLADGVYDVTVSVTNAAGKTAKTVIPEAVKVDITPPEAPTVKAASGRSVRPSISGTWPEKDAKELKVEIAGKSYVLGKDKELSSDGEGNWTLNLSSDLADNTYDVVVTVADAAGNTSADREFGEIVVDSSAPAVPTVNTLLTRSRTPVLTGAWPSKDAVSLTVAIGGKTYKSGEGGAVKTEGNNWSLRLPADLADGTYDIVASAADSAGNVASDESKDELTVDATPPGVPTVNTYKAKHPRPLLSGTFPEGEADTLSILFAGESFAKGSTDALSTDGKGNWSLLTSKDYPRGTYDVKVTVADKAGNSSTDATKDEVVIEGEPKPEEKVAAVNCQKLFDELLAKGQDIEFETARATIAASSNSLLDEMATILGKCPTARVEIGGHTDAQGSNTYNQALSERRALAVRDALIERGAKPATLRAVGYGESKPIADNSTKAGRKKNRRTEFKVQP